MLFHQGQSPSGIGNISSFSGVRVIRSLVLCVCFLDRCLSFCPFSFVHCVVCSSSIYRFWVSSISSSFGYCLVPLFFNYVAFLSLDHERTWYSYWFSLTLLYMIIKFQHIDIFSQYEFWHESKRSSGMNIKVELNLRNMLFFSLLINTKISSVRLR